MQLVKWILSQVSVTLGHRKRLSTSNWKLKIQSTLQRVFPTFVRPAMDRWMDGWIEGKVGKCLRGKPNWENGPEGQQVKRQTPFVWLKIVGNFRGYLRPVNISVCAGCNFLLCAWKTKRNEMKRKRGKNRGKSFEENLSRESIVLYMSMDFHGDDDLLTAHKGHQKMRHNAYTLLHVVLSFPNNIISSAIRSLGVCCVLLISHLMPNKTRRQ